MRTHALALAIGLATAGLAPAFAQPSQYPPPGDQGGPPPGDTGGPPPGTNGGPPPGYNGGPPPGAPPGAMIGPGGGQHNLRARFEAANVTHDGRLTLEQAQAGGMRGVAMHFGEIDIDRKGYVTMQDLHAWMRQRRAERAGAMQGPPPGQGGPPPGQPQY